MTTLIFEHPIFAQHEVPAGHVERPERVEVIGRRLADSPFAELGRGVVEPATEDDILAAHSEAHLAAIQAIAPDSGMVALDADTFLGPSSYEAALCAAGAACQATDAVLGGEADSAFGIIRPPGHHATATRAMGFCIFNNVAIAARRAQRVHGAERVAIVDWDVHHGNGTQDIFERDASVLYASTHQMPLYPYTGAPSETGVGNIVNVALSTGAKTGAFRAAFLEKILPAIDRFGPDLILISAGFDAHWRDPLGGLALTGDDFAWATEQLVAAAERHCKGRIVSMLEGGYDLDALVESASAHVAALMR